MIRRWKSDLTTGRNGMIMRLSLAGSVLFHLFILTTFQNAPLFHRSQGELRTYKVDLIRPPLEGFEPDQVHLADIEPVGGEVSTPSDPSVDDQETITLDTQDKRYSSYTGIIKEKIGLQWRYPPQAKENLIEGRLAVLFSLDRQGRMTRIEVIKPSGSELLDREAIRAVKTAAPYPPFPEHLTVSRLNIEASFDYRIKAGN